MSEQEIPLTRDGFDALKNELHKLKTIERPKVIEEIATARAHGDLRENAEYHAAREKQSFIEGRILLLDDQLARAKVIDFSDQTPDQVRFGARVTVEDQDSGEKKTYQVVGDLEADIAANKISIGSPFAKALLGKRMDDMVEVTGPKGVKEYVVVEINY